MHGARKEQSSLTVYVCSEIGDDRSKHCFLDPATKSAASGRKMTCHLDPTDPSVVDLARFSGSQRRQGRELLCGSSDGRLGHLEVMDQVVGRADLADCGEDHVGRREVEGSSSALGEEG
jgi:hypothetical protein